MMEYATLRIKEIKKETDECKTFILEPAEPLSYEAGQFLTFIFPKNNSEDRRSYSISSSPVLNESLSVTVKKIANGEYSRKLVDHAKVGDALFTIGASGFFVLPENIHLYRQLFFIAAGSGITPVYSLLKTVLKKYSFISVVLIYSNRDKQSTIFREELEALADHYKEHLRIEWLYSTSINLEKARLSKWLLGRLLLQYLAVPPASALFYLCGPFDFMRMANIELLEDGIPAAHIRKEIFNPVKHLVKQLPPDTEKHLVTIHTGGTSYIVETQYPQTILQSMKKAGIPARYSCEAGKCGTCAVMCTRGKVWMSSNEVLLDEEIAKGRVLTCVGYAVAGDVVLEG